MLCSKQLDSYSMMITSKYFETPQDYINMICVNSKFKETLDKFHFNPISVEDTKLFPGMETQHLYNKGDIIIYNMHHYIIWYEVIYTKNMINNNNYTYKNARITDAFIGSEITKVVIPNNIQEIATCSLIYSKQKQITSIIIPTNVKRIGGHCFTDLPNLKSVTIPSSVYYMGDDCFNKCENLTTIITDAKYFIPNISYGISTIMKKQNVQCKNIEYVFSDFYKKNPLLKKVTSFSFPSEVKSIGNYLFFNKTDLTSITFPALTSFGNYSFSGCYNLPTITLPTTLIKIGEFCFYLCTSLSSVSIPSSVTSLDNGLFSNCSSLKYINLPNSIASFGSCCFFNCKNLQVIHIPSSLFYIGKNCFKGCKTLFNLCQTQCLDNVNDTWLFYDKQTIHQQKIIGTLPYWLCTVLSKLGVQCDGSMFDRFDSLQYQQLNKQLCDDHGRIFKCEIPTCCSCIDESTFSGLQNGYNQYYF
ncbi:Leucine rich repeat containing protein BspA family protein [Entamoeba marina]